MSNIGKSHVPCQYSGSADHQSSTCPQAEVCPICETKSHSLKYICPMLKQAKNQDKGHRGYGYDDPPEQEPQINGTARDVQVTQIVGQPTSVISQTSKVYQQNVCFTDEFP